MTRPVVVLAAVLVIGSGGLPSGRRAEPRVQAGANAAAQTAGTAVVAGQVIEAVTSRPVAGAVVTLALGAPRPAAASSQPAPMPSTRRAVAVANADGRFVFRDVPAGSYSITATLDGYAPGATGRRRPGGPGRELVVADGARVTGESLLLWRLAAISGVVRDDRGDPVVGVAVWAMRRTMNAGRAELTLTGGTVESTDDRGYYRLSNLMPGAYVVTVRLSTQSAARTTVDAYQSAVTSGTSAAVTREWQATGALRLASDGLNVGDWQVAVSSGVPQPVPGPNDTLLVHPTLFYPGAKSTAEATVLTLAPGDDRGAIDLMLPLVASVRVAGTLSGPAGPAANHGLRLVPAGAAEPAWDTPTAYATTDAAGRFAFLGVTPGAYIVRAYRVPPSAPIFDRAPPAAGAPPISQPERAPAPPPAGPPPASLFAEVPVSVGTSHIDGLSLTLQPGGRVSGRLAFEGATPPPVAAQLQRISIGLRPLSGTLPGTDARVDAEGRFTTAGYPPGRYIVYHGPLPGTEWSLASVRIGGTDVAAQAFTLGTSDIADVIVTFSDQVTKISGDVRATAGGAPAEGTVVAFPADAQAWLASGMSARRLATAATSATGTYDLRLPLPGDYIVVAIPPEIAPEVDRDFIARFAASGVRLSVAAGETKTQLLTLARAR